MVFKVAGNTQNLNIQHVFKIKVIFHKKKLNMKYIQYGCSFKVGQSCGWRFDDMKVDSTQSAAIQTVPLFI